jgi:hypothetical protein
MAVDAARCNATRDFALPSRAELYESSVARTMLSKWVAADLVLRPLETADPM